MPRAELGSAPSSGPRPALRSGPSSAPQPQLLYLDASALVKLVRREPETNALVAALRPDAKLVASEIAEVEVLRALRRTGGEATAESGRSTLESIRLLPLSREIRRRACELEPATLRSLDAIHLATALWLGELLTAVYAYDTRLIEAARRAGLRVLAPSGDNPDGVADAPHLSADRLRATDAADTPATDPSR